MWKYSLLVAAVIMLANPSYGQTRIYLQHTDKPGRQKNISTKRKYTITISDQVYQDYRLLFFTDSTMTWSAKSIPDTVTLFIDQIMTLRKAKKFQFIEFTAMVAAIGLMITPVIWATEGGDEALGALEAFGGLLAVTVPFVLLREVGRNKNTQGRWRIKTS